VWCKDIGFDKVDFHLHVAEKPSYTNLPIYGLIQECRKRGLLYICLTDHWREDTDPIIFVRERELISQENFGLKIYLSAEVEILDEEGNSPIDIEEHKDIIKKLDFLSAAFHLGEFLPEVGRRRLPKTGDKFIEYVHEKLINMLKNKMFKMILHPTDYGLKDCIRFRLCKSFSFKNVLEEYLEEFVKTAVKYDKVIQINENTALSPPEGYRYFIKMLIDNRVKLTVGSDTHYIEDCIVGRYRNWPGKTEKIVEILKMCGADKNLLWLPKYR